MPGPQLTHNQQIEEARRNMQPPYQPTDYTGLKLDNEIAKQLKEQNQDLSEILTFEPARDNKTRIQMKLPERGCDPETGEEFNIRVNMNYFTRGIVNAVTDEDGRLSPKKSDELETLRTQLMDAVYMENKEESEALGKEFIDGLKIPEEDRADFERFFRANIKGPNFLLLNGLVSPVKFMNEEIQKLSAYQYVQEGNGLPEDLARNVDPAKWRKMQKNTREDYERLCESYRAIATMDPKQEKRILQPSDCIAFRHLTEGLMNECNELRVRNGQKAIGFKAQDYFFSGTQDGCPAQPETEETKRYFDEHHLLTVPIKLNGKDAVLSLENTAPPAGKVLERPAVERTGVGLFESEDAVQRFHYDVNLGPLDNDEAEIKTFGSLAGETAQMGRTAEARYTDVWEREAAYAKEKAKIGTGEAVIDCFARHLAAQSVVESADAAHRPKFDKQTFDKSVEELKQNKSFRLMAQAYGVEKMRAALSAPDPQAASVELFAPQQGKRYPADDATRERLNALGAGMATKGRSEEWLKLREALADPNMKDTSRIFDAVEAYTKGKKSVRKTKEGKESFDLAMTALAIAAKDGDPAAQQRAQNLVDRINEVRGAQNDKHPNHVSLDAYAPQKGEPQKQQEKQAAPQRDAGLS